MKNKYLKGFLMIFLAFIFIAFFFVMSIMDLTNKKDVYETKIDAAGQLLVVENSINGIIPTGKDYYYIGINEDEGSFYIIHAGKNWLEKNFDSEGFAKGNGVSVKGLAKSAEDYEVRHELVNHTNELEGLSFALQAGDVLELNYVRDAVIRIIAGALLIAIAVIAFAVSKRKDTVPSWVSKVITAVVILAIVFVLLAVF